MGFFRPNRTRTECSRKALTLSIRGSSMMHPAPRNAIMRVC